VVDDNEANCQLIAECLTVHTTGWFRSSAVEAVTKARELKPDILLL